MSRSNAKRKNIQQTLEKIELKINEFGQIEKSKTIEQINEFLDEHVDDKKTKYLKD